MSNYRCSPSLSAVTLLSFLAIAPCSAATITYVTATGAIATSSAGSTGPVNAAVQFVTSTNLLTVSIWNYQIETTGDIQSINTVQFLLSPTVAGPGSITGRSGIERTIVSGGTFTDSPTGFTTGWASRTSSFGTNWLELSTLIGGQPSKTIIGPPNASNIYGANGSITNHNPFLATPNQASPIVFTISLTGVTSATTITASRMIFGTDTSTAAQLTLVPQTSAIPEPGSLLLTSVPLLGLLAVRLRRALR